MPPHGLYPVLQHHRSGRVQPFARPAFNSMDFGDVSPDPLVDNKTHGKSSKKEEKKIKREKSPDSKGDKHKVTSSAAGSSRSSKIKVEKHGQAADKVVTSTQKRKRPSTTAHELLTATGTGHRVDSFQISTQYLEDLKSSMGDLSKSFHQSSSVSKTLDRPVKKQKKTSRKSEGDTATKVIGDESGNAGKTAGKEKTYKVRNIPIASSPIKSRVPSSTPRPRQASAPRQTPIPLPPKSPYQRTGLLDPTSQKQGKMASAKAEVLVNETPLSQMSGSANAFDQTPIPFFIPQLSSTPAINRKKTKRGSAINKTPTDVYGTGQMSSSAPAKALPVANGLGAITPQLTMSNLLQYKQALNDKPKPRPRGRSSSVAASTLESSDSGLSTKDMFARVNKPYSRSGAEFDPFVDSSKQKKQKKRKSRTSHDVHDEGSLEAFTTSFNASQKTVNFTDEQDYLKTYIITCSANAAAGPLPCLNKATGCNPKREKLLRLRKPDTTPSPQIDTSISTSTVAELNALAAATTRSLTAETLLTLAVTARIPIPLGRIDGVWKLYCPAYATSHLDKYGFGQRTLHISTLAGVPLASTYTARLALPPRSMPFVIHAFDAPPHAGFRATRLKTVVEGYTLDVVFLGNGYLKVFMDLQELLMGKKMEGKGGREQKMEFWGVREGALVWEEEVDELEVEGKKLFKAYDGE